MRRPLATRRETRLSFWRATFVKGRKAVVIENFLGEVCRSQRRPAKSRKIANGARLPSLRDFAEFGGLELGGEEGGGGFVEAGGGGLRPWRGRG